MFDVLPTKFLPFDQTSKYFDKIITICGLVTVWFLESNFKFIAELFGKEIIKIVDNWALNVDTLSQIH